MARLPILIAPDPFLKTVAAPVTQVDDQIRGLMDDMLETMYDAEGIGLAAVQVGRSERVITIDVSPRDGPRQPLQMANPEVVSASEERDVFEEGCLSVPENYAEVERPARVRVRWLDRDGAPQEREFDGLLATCVQHEIDHLNGRLFIDYLSKLKRDMILRKLRKSKLMAEADD